MAKRFTDTSKWRDKWFRGLNPSEKVLFLYLVDNCDNAGFIEIDYELWAFQIGVEESDVENAFPSLKKVVEKVGEWCWISTFLHHQKNLPLNPGNNAHKQIISLLEMNKNKFLSSLKYKEFLGANMGLNSSIGKGKGKGNSKGKGNVKVEVLESEIWISDLARNQKTTVEKIELYLNTFLDDLEMKDDLDKGVKEVKRHFVNWLNKRPKDKGSKPTQNLAF
jgi:hypothetical protein